MNKRIAVAQLSVCYVLLFCICGSSQNRPAELVGSWKSVSVEYELLTLKSDGTGLKTGAYESEGYRNDIRWKVENGNLIITDEFGTSELRGEYIEKRSGKVISNVVKGWMEGRPAELVGTWEWKSKDYRVLELKSDGKGIKRSVFRGKGSTEDFRWYVENRPFLVKIFSDSSEWKLEYSVYSDDELRIGGGEWYTRDGK